MGKTSVGLCPVCAQSMRAGDVWELFEADGRRTLRWTGQLCEVCARAAADYWESHGVGLSLTRVGKSPRVVIRFAS